MTLSDGSCPSPFHGDVGVKSQRTMRRHKGAPKCPWGEITIKGAKGVLDSQFFMYHAYFENVSHITLCSFTHEVTII
jgi:hypothetical protein